MPDMRFAPPPSIGMKTKSGGLNQISVRSFNERLVLSLLRQHGALSRQDLGKKSGLSAQTVSVIVRALEKDGMILQGEKVRGRVGPPTIPMSLNPDGAFAIGIELGRSSARLAEVDFTGRIKSKPIVLAEDSLQALLSGVSEAAKRMVDGLPKERRSRVVGLGIAMLGDLASSDLELGAEIENTLSRSVGLPIFLQNDVTCAASAEVSFGSARLLDNFIYLFVDATVGCRLVLGGHIFSGRERVSLTSEGESNLQTLARELGLDPLADDFWSHDFDWQQNIDSVTSWSAKAANELVSKLNSALAFVDVDTVVIDGRLPIEIIDKIATSIESEIVTMPALAIEVVRGEIGESSKTIGAANLALNQTYMVQDED